MYGKLFVQMYDGTLAMKGPWQALVTFQQFVILANRHGEVDMTADAIARRTTIPLEVIETGIRSLEEPDPGSRTPDEDGRRIARLADHRDWGWRIVNYDHYNRLRSEEERKEYHRRYNKSRPPRVRRKKDKTDTPATTHDTHDNNHTITTQEHTEPNAHTPVAVAVAVPVIPPPPPMERLTELLELVTKQFGRAQAIGWAAELRMMQQGGRGPEYTCTPEQLETACRELMLQTPTGQNLNLKSLQGFVRRVVAGPTKTHARAGETETSRIQAELRAEAAAEAAANPKKRRT
jgi:hypothetical protein